MGSRLRLEDRKFGRLNVLGFSHVEKGVSWWKCFCSCGNKLVVRGFCLTSGVTKSCGCFRKDNTRKMFLIHGMKKDPIYYRWERMKSRCLNANSSNFKWYGKRGIKISKPWLIFNNFKKDMHTSFVDHVKEYGLKNTTLERIDPNKGYSKKNCKWATWSEQGKNRRNSPKNK